jgi:hypothetical protein
MQDVRAIHRSAKGSILEEQENRLCGNPCHQKKRACGHSEHDQRAKVVIVWLAAQWSAFLHVAETS